MNDRAILLVILASRCMSPRGVLDRRTNHEGDHNLRSSWPQLSTTEDWTVLGRTG